MLQVKHPLVHPPPPPSQSPLLSDWFSCRRLSPPSLLCRHLRFCGGLGRHCPSTRPLLPEDMFCHREYRLSHTHLKSKQSTLLNYHRVLSLQSTRTHGPCTSTCWLHKNTTVCVMNCFFFNPVLPLHCLALKLTPTERGLVLSRRQA